MNEWRSPGKRNIRQCAINNHQVVIALSGGEIVYFEMDQVMNHIQGRFVVGKFYEPSKCLIRIKHTNVKWPSNYKGQRTFSV